MVQLWSTFWPWDYSLSACGNIVSFSVIMQLILGGMPLSLPVFQPFIVVYPLDPSILY